MSLRVVQRSITLVLGLPPVIAGAQTIRGSVVGPDQAPIAGVVVFLVDTASINVARGLSDERGEFRLVAPRPGSYRVQSLRIGFRPSASDVVTLLSGQEVTQRLVLSGIPLSLESVRISGRSSCRVERDSAAATFGVWEQVRAALTATQLAATTRAFSATTVNFDRTVEPDGRRVITERSVVQTEVVRQPWRSISPDDAHRAGYVITDRDGSVTYYAPGLDILLSTGFAEDHCFRLTRSANRAGLGLAFEPTPERQARREIAGIRGTMWVDQGSAELRSLDFRYVNVSSAQAAYAGGAIEFARMGDGTWAISHWSLTMPALVYRVRQRRYGGTDTTVSEVRVLGGDLALAMRGRDTLWAQTPRTLAGTVAEATSRSPVSGARLSLAGTSLWATTDTRGRFSLRGVLPGTYTAEIHTPSLDSIGAAYPVPVTFTDSGDVDLRVPTGAEILRSACGKARLDSPGIVVGTVTMRGDSAPPARVRVVAEWSQLSVRGQPAPPVDRQTRWIETRADTLGAFRLCGVPVSTALTLRAERDSAGSSPVDVRIPEGSRFARADLVLDRIATRAAVFVGLVVADSSRRPVADAEISLPELSKGALTSADGSFRVPDIPPGTHRVHVRRLGYGPLDTTVAFRANQTVERHITLHNVVALDSVHITAASSGLPGFDEHRKIGLGHFLTREQLASQEGRKLSDVMREMPSVVIDNGVGGMAWVSSSRKAPSLGGTNTYLPKPFDAQQGIKVRCYPHVYIDRRLVNVQPDANAPFDVNSISPDRIEAVEWYAGPSQTPAEYNNLNAACGVLVIWTRR